MDTEIKAALGPTNTGKTYLAVTRMLAHADGVIGLPLRLLAREVYERIVREKGVEAAALVTGEERIVPKSARWFACTAEAMPTKLRGKPFCFLAIDEVQLSADPERGHVFTNHLLHSRGREETLVLGAATMRAVLGGLTHASQIEPKERFSRLTHTGAAKLSSLPKRSAVIAFSAGDVYAIAELLRRRHGGAAVVMGSLSPRTRNAQAALFQSGEVDYLVATDAIGMGLNMDIDHVSFAATTKFDGQQRRHLRADELGQIAGRAGRYQRDGSFGTTASARSFDAAMVRRLEEHHYDPVGTLFWRNRVLDFSSTSALIQSLKTPAPREGLTRVGHAIDEQVLAALMQRPENAHLINSPVGVRRLWQVCQIPDFRKSGLDAHIRLLGDIYSQLGGPRARLDEDWLAGKLNGLDNLNGGVDAISSRLAHVRTWAYCTHRADWVGDAVHWQERAHQLEERLSDCLHDLLLQRFVDQRTSVLARALNTGEEADAVVLETGEVKILDHTVGQLTGLSFRPADAARDLAGKTLRLVAGTALAPEINRRLALIAKAEDADFSLQEDGHIHWQGAAIARLKKGSHALHPKIMLVGGQLGQDTFLAKARARLEGWLEGMVAKELKPLIGLQIKVDAGGITGLGRGLGYRLIEAMGALPRHQIAEELRDLDQTGRHALRQCGVRFGAFHVFMPALIKPAPARLLALLYVVNEQPQSAPFLPRAGLTAYVTQAPVSADAARHAGYALFDRRLVRIDILERLADLIREAQKAHKGGIFAANEAMLSLLGCSHDDLGKILIALKYKRKTKSAGDSTSETWGPARIGRKKPANAKKKTAQKTTIDPNSPFAVLQSLK